MEIACACPCFPVSVNEMNLTKTPETRTSSYFVSNQLGVCNIGADDVNVDECKYSGTESSLTGFMNMSGGGDTYFHRQMCRSPQTPKEMSPMVLKMQDPTHKGMNRPNDYQVWAAYYEGKYGSLMLTQISCALGGMISVKHTSIALSTLKPPPPDKSY